jgi:hypothetical protein
LPRGDNQLRAQSLAGMSEGLLSRLMPAVEIFPKA